MTTEAEIGYLTKIEVSTDAGSTWAEVGEVNDLAPPAFSADTPDATHFRSAAATREAILGLEDPGECSFDIAFVPGSTGDVKLRAIRAARARVQVRITFPNAVIWVFTAFLTGYEPSVPLDDKMTATITFKVTGTTSYTPAAAPANVTLPSVSGIAQEGGVLTAWPGVWSGAPTFAYQWQTDGGGSFADISGATSETYTVLTGDIGDALRCVVTGTNAAGSASATSGATADVVEA